jgi:hypothetical protein
MLVACETTYGPLVGRGLVSMNDVRGSVTKRQTLILVSLLAAAASVSGCGDSATKGAADGGGADELRDGSSGAPSDARSDVQADNDASTTPEPEPDGPRTSFEDSPTVTGVYDVQTALPKLPKLENVVGTVGSDSVAITFLPVDDARDYRVYVLPADEDVIEEGDNVYVNSAIYRCAGDRSVPDVDADDRPAGSGLGVRTFVDGQDVAGYRRTQAEATLGHVYYAPGEGRAPVHALGDPDPKADNWAFIARVKASRTKLYTTSDEQRASLLVKGWRDDGVVFYVPAQPSAQTETLYTSLDADGHTRYYFRDGTEKNMRGQPQAAFQVLKQAAEGTQPLYRVFYTKYQAFSHDELAYGKTLFERARYQGASRPMTELLWTGLMGPTTLVVEALDSGCPYPGRLAAANIPAGRDVATTVSGYVDYAEAITPMQAQAKAAHGELFLNGQHATTDAPKAVARAFLRVTPQTPESFDYFADFAPGSNIPALSEVPCGAPNGNCFQQWRQVSSEFDIHWHTIVTGQRAIGYLFGELWVRYADWAADTNGKFRFTPLQKGTVDADTYLHATMEVTAVSTGRRYPQILVSDRSAPVQDFLDQGNTVVLEAFRNWPNFVELQVCDHRRWDVNDQCPFYQFYEYKNAGGETKSLAPIDEVGELTAADRRTRFDLLLSSKRAYVLVDRKPYGCVDLPESGIPQGEVTVTFGDVLYHSDADSPFGFHKTHLRYDTERRFDNLGFSSGVAPPAWDYARIPCMPASSIDMHR